MRKPLATRFLEFVAGAALAMLAACAMPPIDREQLEEMRATPVRLEGSRGALTYAQSQAILGDLKKRSSETSIFDRHIAVEESIAGSALSVGNQAVLLEDGKAAYPAMLAAIRSARHHIHLETYIYDDDEVGREFAQALMERVRAGVQVRLLYDSFGSKRTSREFFKPLEAAGVQVLEYHPLDPVALLTKGPVFNQRDHRKLLIVDGRIAFLGGINISSVYASPSGPSRNVPFDQRAWRDTQLQVEGPVVNDFQKVFAQVWEKEKKEKIEGPRYFPTVKPAGPLVVRALDGSPDQPVNPLYVTFLSAIASAEASVHITIAYFVPDPQLLGALTEAARRGVDVKLILPSRTDFWAVFHAGRSFYEDLLEAGVRIFERKDRLLHSKSAVVDGVWSTVVSTNMDWRSLLHNKELNAVVLGPEFGGRMEALFEKDLGQSEEITREKWRNRPLQDRLREAAARAWAYFL